MAKSRSYSALLFGIAFSPSARASYLSSNLYTSLSLLKTCLFFLELIESKALLLVHGCWGALYKYLNTIQYRPFWDKRTGWMRPL